MKRILSFVLIIVLLVGVFPAQIFAAEPMTYRGVTDNIIGNDYTVYNSSGEPENFSYSVPKDGATVLIFFSTLCGNSMSLFSQLEECSWIDNPYVNIIAVESKTQNVADLEDFCDYFMPTKKGAVDFYYANSRLMWDYFHRISSAGVLTWPVVFVITKSGAVHTIEYGDMSMSSAASLYKTLCAVSSSFANTTEDVYATKNLAVAGIHTYSDTNTILDLVNEERNSAGLGSLILDETLTELAMQRAAECAIRYSHDRPNDESCFTILDGKVSSGGAAENIAYGYPYAESVTAAWINSPGHYANIMSAEYTHIGVGVAWVDGIPFWVQLFHTNASDTVSRDYSNKDPEAFVRQVAVAERKINARSLERSDSITVTANKLATTTERFSLNYNYNGAPRMATVLPVAFVDSPNQKLDIKDPNGIVVATLESANDGSGELIVRPKASGIGTVSLPVYEGQTDPFKYTITVTVEDSTSCSHNWSGASCDSPKTCTKCGTVQGSALGHNYVNGVCSRCGGTDPNYTPESLPGNIIRIAGNTRYQTSIGAADELKEILGVSKFENIIVASGEQFADALAGSYLAAVKNAPILLVKPGTASLIQEYIRANLMPGGTVYILGGENAVPKTMENGLSGLNVKRLGGATRYDTNLLILNEAGLYGDAVIICTGKDFADSLSASAIGLPIVLVKDNLTSAQVDYLKNTSCNFVIIGGTNAVNKRIEERLISLGRVTRLSGGTRYDTSAMVARKFFGDPGGAVIAYGENFPDGLSGGPVAHACGAPLLLVRPGREYSAASYISEKDISFGLVLGGTSVLPDKTVRNVFATK